MKKFTKSVVLFSLIAAGLYGQNNSNVPMPNLIPKSPEIKGFERYGEYPVSEYTGIPSINIPLHTIQVSGLDFPISLDYHAAGIRVTQESTWVGLGWNLLAGGCISTVPVGAVDATSIQYAQFDDWDKIMNYRPENFSWGDPRRFHEDGLVKWDCTGYHSANSQTTEAILNDGLKGQGERDIYRVSLLGYSFEISIHPVTGGFIYNGEKNEFIIEKNGWQSWILTDEKGYVYVFSALEMLNPGSLSTTSAWYLTAIYRFGVRLIHISYGSAYVTYLPQISERIITDNNGVRIDTPTRYWSFPDKLMQRYISSIVSPMDSIVFQTKARIDLEDALALDKIVIYENSTKKEIRRYVFDHDYFTGVSTGAGTASHDYVTKRLRLTKLTEMRGNQTKGSHQFEYNTVSLPYKTSFSQDFWGYYNGQENSGGKLEGPHIPSDILALYPLSKTLLPDIYCPAGFTGANRLPNANLTTAGMLKSITYPTGGKTEFEFEAHQFNSSNIRNLISYWRDQTQSFHVFCNGNPAYGYPETVFENEIQRKVIVSLKINCQDRKYNLHAFKFVISGTNFNKTYSHQSGYGYSDHYGQYSLEMEDELILPAGEFTLAVFVDPKLYPPYHPPYEHYQGYDNVNSVEATINYTKNVQVIIPATAVTTGAGVRIKSLKSYTDNNAVAFTKQYSYALSDGQSSGQLLHPVQFMNSREKVYAIPGATNPDADNSYSRNINEVFSHNLYQYTASGCNAVVGYSRVEVRTVASSGNANTGVVVSEFENLLSSSYYHNGRLYYPYSTPYPAQYKNGKLARRIILNSQGDTISVERNTYSVGNLEHHYVNVSVADNYEGPTDQCISYNIFYTVNLYAFNGRFDIIVYPTNSYTVQLTSKSETLYSGNQKVEKTTAYTYDSFNYQIKKVTETANGKNHAVEYKYPHNYSSGEIPAQIRNRFGLENIISIPIEEFTFIDNTPVASKKTDYALFDNNSFLAPHTVSLRKGTNPYEARLVYESYDSFGNPQHIVKDATERVVYLWGYNYQYPIAEIKNATYAEVTAKISDATLKAIAARVTLSSADSTSISNLRTQLPGAQVTTYTYHPLEGIRSITDPRGVVTRYNYDTFGRLQAIIRAGRQEETYDYRYKN